VENYKNISNFSYEINHEDKSFFIKLFNYKDPRYLVLISLNIIFYQVIRYIDFENTGLLATNYFIGFPIFWYVIFQSTSAYIGFQSKKVVGKEKIFWILSCALLPWIFFPIFLFLKRNVIIDEDLLAKEDYLTNFFRVSLSVYLLGYFLF